MTQNRIEVVDELQSIEEIERHLMQVIENEVRNDLPKATRRGFLQNLVAAGLAGGVALAGSQAFAECTELVNWCGNTCSGDNSCSPKNWCQSSNSCESSNSCTHNVCQTSNYCYGNACTGQSNSCSTTATNTCAVSNSCTSNMCQVNTCEAGNTCSTNMCSSTNSCTSDNSCGTSNN
jgi:hypothetical protein